MPSLLDIDLSRDNAIENDPADRIRSNRFNRDAESAKVFGRVCLVDRDGRITNETSQFNRSQCRIGDRRLETDDAADWDSLTGRVVNSNGCRVSQVSARSATAGQSVAMQRLGRGQQPVVFGRRNVEVVTGADSSGQLCDT